MKWIAPPKTRAELAQIERVMQGRYSIGEPLPRQGVGTAAGAAIPITPRGSIVLPVEVEVPTRRGTPKPVPGVRECAPPCIQPIPINPKEAQTQMLSPTEKTICQTTGVAEADFAHAKAKRGELFPDADKNFQPHDAADGDPDGDEVAAALQHLICDEDDDGIDHVTEAYKALGRHLTKRVGTHSAHRVSFV